LLLGLDVLLVGRPALLLLPDGLAAPHHAQFAAAGHRAVVVVAALGVHLEQQPHAPASKANSKRLPPFCDAAGHQAEWMTGINNGLPLTFNCQSYVQLPYVSKHKIMILLVLLSRVVRSLHLTGRNIATDITCEGLILIDAT
jgi:hypothetical protein